MFMPFEIVSICVWLWYFFQKHVVLQLIQIYIKSTCYGFMSLVISLFVSLPCLECSRTSGVGFSIILIGTTFPWYLHIGTLVVSQSVKQCITVDFFPHILANVDQYTYLQQVFLLEPFIYCT